MNFVEEAAEETEVVPNGTVLGGRFTVIEHLGAGGMGYVYRAQDAERGCEVALKLIIRRYLDRPERIERFFNEARLGHQVGPSKHVVEFYEYGQLEGDGHPYITMELLLWRSLSAEMVLLGRLAPRQVCTFARRIADGLLAMHRAGVVHRDVNLRNVLVEGEGLKLIDFSLAARFEGDNAGLQFGDPRRLTRAGDRLGTPGYMSLELIMNEPPHPSMDVYSFGILLFELVAGRNPFGFIDRPTFIDLQVAGALEQPRIDPAIYRVPEELADLVHRCAARYPTERPTMAEAARQLDALLAAMGTPWREPSGTTGGALTYAGTSVDVPRRGALQVVRETPEPVASAESPVEPTARVPRRRLVIAVAGLLLAGAAAIGLSRPAELQSAQSGLYGSWNAADPRMPRARLRPLELPLHKRDVQPSVAQEDVVVRTPRSPKQRSPERVSNSKASQPDCAAVREAASSARGRGAFREVLQQTQTAGCWSDDADRLSLRAEAYAELGDVERCVATAEKSQNESVRRKWIGICRRG